MPTLIRLFLVLLVLAGLGFAGMIALTVMVDPGEKDITIKIPARELAPPAGGLDGPIDLNDLPAPVNVAPREPSAEPSAPVSGEIDASGVQTVSIPE
jgi:hypothetical protein